MLEKINSAIFALDTQINANQSSVDTPSTIFIKPAEIVDGDSITVAGITVRTDNSAEGFKKIENHWGRFFHEQISASILTKQSEAIYEVYYDYESDASGSYTALLGNLIHSDTAIAPNLEKVTLPKARYVKFFLGNPQTIPAAWKIIWQLKALPRSYGGDFEIIGKDSAEIYIAVQKDD